jgi:hypothetical protein
MQIFVVANVTHAEGITVIEEDVLSVRNSARIVGRKKEEEAAGIR